MMEQQHAPSSLITHVIKTYMLENKQVIELLVSDYCCYELRMVLNHGHVEGKISSSNRRLLTGLIMDLYSSSLISSMHTLNESKCMCPSLPFPMIIKYNILFHILL